MGFKVLILRDIVIFVNGFERICAEEFRAVEDWVLLGECGAFGLSTGKAALAEKVA